jgi:hypothetical protein
LALSSLLASCCDVSFPATFLFCFFCCNAASP